MGLWEGRTSWVISAILGLAKSHGSNPPPLETSLTPGHDGILGKSASVDPLSTLDIRTPTISSEEISGCEIHEAFLDSCEKI